MKFRILALTCLSLMVAAGAFAQQFGPPGHFGPGPDHHFGPHPFTPIGPRPVFHGPDNFNPGWAIQQCQNEYQALQSSYNTLNANYSALDVSYNSLVQVNAQNSADLQACNAALNPAPTPVTPPSLKNVCTLTGSDAAGNTLAGQGESAVMGDPAQQAAAVIQAKQAAEANCSASHNQNTACTEGAFITFNCIQEITQ